MEKIKRIPIEGTSNLRDIGGYGCDGGYSKWHTCYRCDLPLCKQQGFQELYDTWNVRCILDLRSTSECTMQSYSVDPRMEYIHIPFIKEDGNDKSAMHSFQTSMAESYLALCMNSGEQIVKILTKIAETLDRGAVMYHCTAGKDRTGIISFFLLHLIGVHKSDILADYQVSSTYNFYGNSDENTLLSELGKSDNQWIHSQPETLFSLFAYFHEHDMVEYLQANGMKIEDISKIRKKLIQVI